MVNRKPLSKKNGNNENLRDWKLLEGSLSIGNNKNTVASHMNCYT